MHRPALVRPARDPDVAQGRPMSAGGCLLAGLGLLIVTSTVAAEPRWTI
jgi:hypothetical protein